MTNNPETLFSSRTSTREFLSYKTAAAARSARYDDLSAATLADLSEAFPGILFGTVFITQAMESFRNTPSFASMAIRIDGGVESGGKLSTEEAEARVAVLETLDSLCSTHRGVWGLVGENFFGASSLRSSQTVSSFFSRARRPSSPSTEPIRTSSTLPTPNDGKRR